MWQKLTNQFDAVTWNAFVKNEGPQSGRFLQSWEWGEFQGADRWVWEDKGVANVILKNLPVFGKYAYSPRGPIVVDESLFPELVEGIATALDSILFFRCDLSVALPSESTMKKTIDVQPARTWMTELTTFHTREKMSTVSAEQLLSSMHSKTRYNIKLAERHGVQIDFDTMNFDEVWPLFEATSGRGKFRLHEKHYYKKMLEILNGDCHAHLLMARFENKPIAANIVIDFAGVRTYLHGASSYEYRAFMAPYLLHWFLLKDAIEQGMTHYDWWGIAPEGDPNHPWAGITRFKRSFPGREVVYPGTYDLVKKPGWYTVYQLARAMRRL